MGKRMQVLAGFKGEIETKPISVFEVGDTRHHKMRGLLLTTLATQGVNNPLRPIIQSVRVGNSPGKITAAYRQYPGNVNWWKTGQAAAVAVIRSVANTYGAIKNAQGRYTNSKRGLVVSPDTGTLITRWNLAVQDKGSHRKRGT